MNPDRAEFLYARDPMEDEPPDEDQQWLRDLQDDLHDENEEMEADP